MREFGKVLTPEQVAAVLKPSRPWVEPTEIVTIPTPEEMQNWFPSEADEDRRFRWEQNVVTGERKAIELTLDEYRARHVAKLMSKNEYVQFKQEETRIRRRRLLLETFIDTLEKASE